MSVADEIQKAVKILRGRAQDAVLLEVGEELPPAHNARSFVGGLPRLPPGVDWPVVPRRELDGAGEGPITPSFICQIDLPALPPVPQRGLLPPRGTLYFFCNTQFFELGDPACSVLFHPTSCDGFVERQPPANLMRIGGHYHNEILLPEFPDDDPRSKAENAALSRSGTLRRIPTETSSIWNIFT